MRSASRLLQESAVLKTSSGACGHAKPQSPSTAGTETTIGMGRRRWRLQVPTPPCAVLLSHPTTHHPPSNSTGACEAHESPPQSRHLSYSRWMRTLLGSGGGAVRSRIKRLDPDQKTGPDYSHRLPVVAVGAEKKLVPPGRPASKHSVSRNETMRQRPDEQMIE